MVSSPVFVTEAFVQDARVVIKHTSNDFRLSMGGYYSEPDSTELCDDKDTHMMFGVRCREMRIAVADQHSFTILAPVDDPHNDDKAELVVARWILSSRSFQENLQTSSIAVWDGPGSNQGLVSLALATCLPPGKHVTVYGPDEPRLQLLKATHLFYNDGDPNSLSTVHVSSDASSVPMVNEQLTNGILILASGNIPSSATGEGSIGDQALPPQPLISKFGTIVSVNSASGEVDELSPQTLEPFHQHGK